MYLCGVRKLENISRSDSISKRLLLGSIKVYCSSLPDRSWQLRKICQKINIEFEFAFAILQRNVMNMHDVIDG